MLSSHLKYEIFTYLREHITQSENDVKSTLEP